MKPLRFLLVGTILCAIFLLWLLTVLVPLTFIELRYQYHKIMADTFHVSDIRGLIYPQFHLDLNGSLSRYKENGITIPSLFIDEPVIYNVDPNNEIVYLEALRNGIAHASGTTFPGAGGLGYYFAHSSTPTLVRQFNAIFYLLDKLAIGDEVYIFHDGTRYDYKIFAKQITDPTDLSFLHHQYETETIVLQTCWPPGTTTKRLLVFARRTSE
jgi:LPXTG-site transpeptidase (sortase) family protein